MNGQTRHERDVFHAHDIRRHPAAGLYSTKVVLEEGVFDMSHHQRQKGFTLIELIIVLVILGILAAIAIPRFISLQREARIATVDSYFTALRSGTNLVFAKSAAAGLNTAAAACVNLETGATAATHGDAACNVGTQGVNTVYGYPAAAQNSLSPLFDDLSARWSFSGGTAQLDAIATCSVAYVAPTAAGGRPTITRDVTGC
ncbi:prepilin-type N-terminal cleavage/methylation domain-containing protein [Pseudothauera nasutitermitis]|uniref:Prepilin-type N-terminal cleavage/methylation domain-containing protein n=1 Tax=Pseudothauera nasutitermitis TaxID=2565930 RepID=A0A4S4AVK0_9RHOO|nr:prepilin-type N-terminal cleavage/methylation domain-containing protein [Pseudothauera nasutitermitis]THF63590.1 prepilin-type N-terminal cleavage/methylation domain-containing protein [Pseudothauera nasutitermitis]